MHEQVVFGKEYPFIQMSFPPLGMRKNILIFTTRISINLNKLTWLTDGIQLLCEVAFSFI